MVILYWPFLWSDKKWCKVICIAIFLSVIKLWHKLDGN